MAEIIKDEFDLQRAEQVLDNFQISENVVVPGVIESMTATIRALWKEQADETAWLVEVWPSVSWAVPTYYGIGDETVCAWVTDVNKAIRFKRREDAEMLIAGEVFNGAKAIEHMWVSATPKDTTT